MGELNNKTFSDYYNSMDLHIGVTTSTGTIVEFDKQGLRKHRSNHWNQCLLLDQVCICAVFSDSASFNILVLGRSALERTLGHHFVAGMQAKVLVGEDIQRRQP